MSQDYGKLQDIQNAALLNAPTQPRYCNYAMVIHCSRWKHRQMESFLDGLASAFGCSFYGKYARGRIFVRVAAYADEVDRFRAALRDFRIFPEYENPKK